MYYEVQTLTQDITATLRKNGLGFEFTAHRLLFDIHFYLEEDQS